MGELSTTRELLGALALALQVTAAVFVGWRAGRAVARDDGLLAALAGALVAVATPVALSLALAMAGLLALPASLVAHLAAAAAAWRWLPTPPPRPAGRPAAVGWPAVLAVAGGVAYAALGVDLSLGPPSQDFDTREYHVVNLATWLQGGSLWDLPYQSPSGVSATHPGDAELLGAWLALPSGGDELLYVVPVVFGALALLAGAVLARELAPEGGDGRAALGALAALAVLLAPLYLSSQVASLSTDLTVAACVAAALALLAAGWRRAWPVPLLAVAGVALGLALGSKYTALVPVFAVAVLAAVAIAPRRRWWWLAPGVVGLAGPWFLRNLVATGNPLFPQELGPLPGGDSPFEVLDDTMLEHLLAADGTIAADWLELGARFVGPAALLALAGVGVGAARWRRSRSGAVTATVAAAAFVGYLAIPFSGGGPAGQHHLIASSLRYGMTALLLGSVLLAGLAGRRLAVAAVGTVLAVDLWRIRELVAGQRPEIGFGDGALARAALVGAVAAAVVGWWPARRPRAVVALAGLAVAVGAAGFVALHRYDRGAGPSPLEATVVAHGGLDEPVVPLGVVDLRSMLGPRLDRRLVVVSRGGEADEIPFATHGQVRRILLADATAPPAPSSLGDELDAALRRSGVRLLAIGPDHAGAYPEGWAPDPADWCALATVERVALFARCTS